MGSKYKEDGSEIKESKFGECFSFNSHFFVE